MRTIDGRAGRSRRSAWSAATRPERRWRVIATLLLVLVLSVGCVGVGVDEYREFDAAVESGATCEQLLEIAANFEDEPKTRARIDDDLRAIGCVDRNSERSDA